MCAPNQSCAGLCSKRGHFINLSSFDFSCSVQRSAQQPSRDWLHKLGAVPSPHPTVSPVEEEEGRPRRADMTFTELFSQEQRDVAACCKHRARQAYCVGVPLPTCRPRGTTRNFSLPNTNTGWFHLFMPAQEAPVSCARHRWHQMNHLLHTYQAEYFP